VVPTVLHAQELGEQELGEQELGEQELGRHLLGEAHIKAVGAAVTPAVTPVVVIWWLSGEEIESPELNRFNKATAFSRNRC
jgi:hypothetical protein